jgi:hypothetical protein
MLCALLVSWVVGSLMSWQDAAEVPIAVDVRTGLLRMSTERPEAPGVMFRCVDVEVWGCCCSCRPWLAMIAAHPRHDVVRRLERWALLPQLSLSPADTQKRFPVKRMLLLRASCAAMSVGWVVVVSDSRRAGKHQISSRPRCSQRNIERITSHCNTAVAAEGNSQ